MQFDVTPEKDGMMLSRLLLQVADVPQWAVKQAMKNRDVRVDGVRVSGDVRVRKDSRFASIGRRKSSPRKGRASPPCRLFLRTSISFSSISRKGIQAQNEENPLAGGQRADPRDGG